MFLFLRTSERRNGNGARVYGANLDAKIAHGKEAQFQLGFTAQRSRYTHEEAWTKVDGVDLTTKRMPRTPDYYGYFTFSSAPVKNFDFSLSGTYTGKMIVPHYAGYIEKDRMENTPQSEAELYVRAARPHQIPAEYGRAEHLQ